MSRSPRNALDERCLRREDAQLRNLPRWGGWLHEREMPDLVVHLSPILPAVTVTAASVAASRAAGSAFECPKIQIDAVARENVALSAGPNAKVLRALSFAHWPKGTWRFRLVPAVPRGTLTEDGSQPRKEADQSGVARSLNALTAIAGFRENWDQARTLSHESHELALSAGDERTAAFALFNLADVALFLGRFADARDASADALRLFRRINHAEGIALALGIAALAAVEEGNRDEANKAIREGLPIAADLDFPEPLAWCLEAAAALATDDEKAAVIAGATQRVGESIMPRPSVENLHRRTLDSLRERLEPGKLDYLTSGGRGIPREQAVNLALDTLDDVQ